MSRKKFSSLLLIGCLTCPPLATAAQARLTVHTCLETQTCDQADTCVNAKTRLVLAEINAPATDAMYLDAGPMVAEVSGGLLLERNWVWITADLPEPSDALGRAYFLKHLEPIGMSAHVFRMGREVAGMKRADWVRADYSCKQVIF
ncbi:MAG: hypothetical protein ACSHWS_08380 [Sulfitobacter sp.]